MIKHNIDITCNIYEFKLNYSDDQLQAYMDEITRLCDNNINQPPPFDYVLNSPSISSIQVWKQTSIFNDLLATILAHGKYVTDMHNVKVDSAWALKYNKNQYTILHGHKEALVAFGFYFNNSTTPIMFENSLSITPTKNTLIIFPGYLKHGVAPHQEEHPRFGLAGNIHPDINY